MRIPRPSSPTAAATTSIRRDARSPARERDARPLWLLPWGPDLIPHPGSIIRLDALRAIGLFDPSLKYAMDLDAFLSLRAHGRFLSTRTSVSAFRWHPDSLTVANREGSSREAREVKARHLPGWLRPVSPVWSIPVAWAAALAAGAVSRRARRLAGETTREKA